MAGTADSSEASNEWWRDFGDPSLDRLVEQAMRNNRDLAAAAARVAAAAGQARLAGADRMPAIDLGFSPSRARQIFVGLPIPGSNVLSTTTSNFGLSLDLSWELDLWGRIRAGELAAQSQLEAAAADFRGARLSLAAQTANAWFAVVESRAQRELAEQTVESFTASAERIRSRFERGVRSSLDLRLAVSEQETAAAALASREEILERATRSLQILIGRYPDGVVVDGSELPTLEADVPAGLPADILGRRPDLVAAERRLAAADADLASARADLYPRVSLTASGGTRSDDIEDLLDGDFRVWSIAGNLLAPLFDGGRRESVVDVRDAQRLEAYADWAGTVLRALSEVESALAAEEHLGEQLQRLEAAAREAVAAQRLSEDRYGRGLTDVITLLTAQRRSFTARSQVLELRRRRLEVRIDLLLALGGGFQEPPSEPSNP